MVRLPNWSNELVGSLPAVALARRLLKKQLTVFNYHEVSHQPSEFCIKYDLNVYPEIFRRQIQWIKKNFQVVDASQVLEEKYDMPAAFITFDDGFAGVFENALPILEQEEVPSLVFLNMAPILGEVFLAGGVAFFKQKHPHRFKGKSVAEACDSELLKWLLYSNNEEIEEPVRRFTGRFGTLENLQKTNQTKMKLGNHGYRHLNFLRLEHHQIMEDLFQNENYLRAFPNYVNMFSYPFGQPNSSFNSRTNTILKDAGVRKCFTAYPLHNSKKENWQIHRVSCFQKLDTEKLFLGHSALVTLLNTLRFKWR